jgi:membrane-associated phospholipid phosphatase
MVWQVICSFSKSIIAAVGGGFNYISGNKRPFDLSDSTVSLPYVEKERITTATLVVVSLIVPAVIIFLVCLVLVPGPGRKSTSRTLLWRRKLWEWHTGWLGLALSLALAFLFTNGSKNLFGKPRPDLLSRCQPDLRNVEPYRVGFGDRLVSWTICQQTDKSILDDGFRSFPSGHSSCELSSIAEIQQLTYQVSWAGLTYLTLWLCAKFAITIPFLSPASAHSAAKLGRAFPEDTSRRAGSSELNTKHSVEGDRSSLRTSNDAGTLKDLEPLRNQAASPPAYLFVMILVPICAAIYISSTRFSDFRHFGFDILFGSLVGAVFAWFGFRWTHLPIRQGAGWSWGARSRDRAFGIGMGVMGYVGDEGWESNRGATRPEDLESRPEISARPETTAIASPAPIQSRMSGTTA